MRAVPVSTLLTLTALFGGSAAGLADGLSSGSRLESPVVRGWAPDQRMEPGQVVFFMQSEESFSSDISQYSIRWDSRFALSVINDHSNKFDVRATSSLELYRLRGGLAGLKPGEKLQFYVIEETASGSAAEKGSPRHDCRTSLTRDGRFLQYTNGTEGLFEQRPALPGVPGPVQYSIINEATFTRMSQGGSLAYSPRIFPCGWDNLQSNVFTFGFGKANLGTFALSENDLTNWQQVTRMEGGEVQIEDQGKVNYKARLFGSFQPVDRNIEITRVIQEGGARTSDEKQMVFENGALRIQAQARVRPAGDAGSLRWEAPAIGNIQPSVRSTLMEDGVVSAVITYQGLPLQNGSFGNKTLKATLRERTAEKPFQVFFDRDGTDNPQSRGKPQPEPNWFVYWKQGPVPDLDRFLFSHNSGMAAGYNFVDKKLYMTREGPGVIPGLNARLVTADTKHSYHLQRERCEGILSVAATVRHELRHKELFEMSGSDYDGDHVVDDIETNPNANPWLDVFQPNTYANFNVELFYPDLNAWLKEGTADQQKAKAEQVELHRYQLKKDGDNELLAIIAEASRVANEAQDWACPGSQAKKP